MHPSVSRRLAGTLLVWALATPALAEGEPATAAPPQAATAPAEAQSAPRKRTPPPTVLVIPLGFGVLLPVTLPTATPRTRVVPVETRDGAAPSGEAPSAQPAKEVAR